MKKNTLITQLPQQPIIKKQHDKTGKEIIIHSPNTVLVRPDGKPIRPQTAVELVREAQQDWRLRLNPYEKKPTTK
jgi:hypothetical protein